MTTMTAPRPENVPAWFAKSAAGKAVMRDADEQAYLARLAVAEQIAATQADLDAAAHEHGQHVAAAAQVVRDADSALQRSLRALAAARYARGNSLQALERAVSASQAKLRETVPTAAHELTVKLSARYPYQPGPNESLESAEQRNEAIKKALDRLAAMEFEAIVPDDLTLTLEDLRAGIPGYEQIFGT